MLEKDFLTKCKSIYSVEDCQLINYALDFAKDCHKGQTRVSGEPYVNHPINAALILTDLGMDSACICAALLHDVIEDTDCTEETMKRKFGEEITGLVVGVTKLSKIKFTSKVEEQAENFRKLFFSMANDLRVLFIKLADRLHNMRTLQSLPEEKQQRIAHETLDIYAPLASRLGISNIKCELEDLCMKYLFREEFVYLSGTLDLKREERMYQVARIADAVEKELQKAGIKGEIKGRPKHFYSIYKKMKNQNKTLDQIYDLIAVRVIVETVKDCYAVLGIIHSIWKPVPGRFKDYIAMPKPNLYQSLHTTVVSNFGQIFEIQIRTHEMNRKAEYGIAAHWKYKEGKNTTQQTDLDKKIGWIQQVIESEKDINDSQEFLAALKSNIDTNEIYVFTPKGDVFDLAVGSTCVDFAFRVHSAVGNKCVGAKINSKIMPLNTVLETGDMVEILTSNSSKGPSRDWLKFVKTPQAKARIKAYFKKAMLAENIKNGKEMLEREAKRRGYNLADLLQITEGIDNILNRYSLSSVDDMYATVGYGGLTTNQVLLKLIDRYKKYQAIHNPIDITTETVEKSPEKAPLRRSASAVIVEGYDDFVVKFAKCCNPVPGDAVIGYASRGSGVSIHRADCPNVRNMEKERILRTTWASSNNGEFTAILRVECLDSPKILASVVALSSANGVNISSLEMHRVKDKAIITVGITVKTVDDLEQIIKKVEAVEDVLSVKRGH